MNLNLKVGIPLLFLGVGAIAGSIYYVSTPLAFVGLSLFFWGLLFTLILNTRYVKPEVISSMLDSSSSSLENIVQYLGIKGNAVYIPLQLNPYLSSLSGMEHELVYLPMKDLPDEDTVAELFQKTPPGVRITPPGSRLATLIEKSSGLNFKVLDVKSLKELLGSTLVKKLELADRVDVKTENNSVTVVISRPVFQEPCKDRGKDSYVCQQIGCPLCSSLACVLCRVSQRPVRIQSCTATEVKIQITYFLL